LLAAVFQRLRALDPKSFADAGFTRRRQETATHRESEINLPGEPADNPTDNIEQVLELYRELVPYSR
jgi:hypothetical protein